MRLEEMTVDELVAEYNRRAPAELLERWDGDRAELEAMARVARKQSMPDGIIGDVTLTPPGEN